MTAAEAQAGAALKASAEINKCQQVLTQESRELLASLLRDEMRVAVAEGISSALTDDAAERFWNKGLEVMQRQAAERTGRFVLSGLTAMAKKAMWVGLFVLAVYSIGGWTLVKTTWAAFMKQG